MEKYLASHAPEVKGKVARQKNIAVNSHSLLELHVDWKVYAEKNQSLRDLNNENVIHNLILVVSWISKWLYFQNVSNVYVTDHLEGHQLDHRVIN